MAKKCDGRVARGRTAEREVDGIISRCHAAEREVDGIIARSRCQVAERVLGEAPNSKSPQKRLKVHRHHEHIGIRHRVVDASRKAMHLTE